MFRKIISRLPMAKRTNQNQQPKKMDDQDDQTIIKVTTSKSKQSQSESNVSKSTRKPSSTRRKVTNKQTTAKATTEPAKKSRSNSNNTKSRSNQNTKREEVKPARKASPKKVITRKTSEEPSNRQKTKSGEKKSTDNTPTTSKSNTSTSNTSKTIPSNPISTPDTIKIAQSVGILIDGNNIEMSLTKLTNNKSAVLNYDTVIPKLLNGRGLNRLIYFREGVSISQKLADRLHTHYFGSVVPCHKSADIPLSINATQLADKVDTIIILSGDSDYVELVRHLKYKGVRVEIAAIEITTANILKDEADYYHPITREDAFILK